MITEEQAKEIISLLKDIRRYTGKAAGLVLVPDTDELISRGEAAKRLPEKYGKAFSR